ncbi:ATP-binding protein [Leptospira santarosai]|uniref:ATP-binding protein n=1 Tax=Leptospira santarosai TaxID=28183 RepID=UPI00062D7B30|nr:ATP-binding protein [Leptospira santarosai]AVV79834.1 Uncharacterized protein XB15_02066 [Leptospira santarosai]MDI7164607.1 ATP-binding protein [Leptospira santarosai]MDO6394016.1 ATP-binding protein [Leptospira santarosai]OLY59237.1 exonuclease SbcCD, C subunit [Leptospira santarosai serovar Guaricura]ONF85713.1 exonuclease SbcCD, C subunit [Leptospira santarosai serovar Grippotyphosa]
MTDLFSPGEIAANTGYRLEFLEILNWGTFHGRIWKLRPEGENFLLTGANGSGKSTLVDAILTLLVPAAKRNYNLASGLESKKRDRSERSYVEGHYGRSSSGSEGILKIRGKQEECYSVLSAVFEANGRFPRIRIAQIFWFESGELKKIYLFSDKELDFEKDLVLGKRTVKELKADLKNSGARLYDQFKAYNVDFRKAVGLESEKAIDLFNQIVAIKSLGVLNEFVREHMLESRDKRSRIEELNRNFSDLSETYEAIVNAKEQLKLLEPIEKKAAEYREWNRKAADLQALIVYVPYYFAEKNYELRQIREQDYLFELSRLKDRSDELSTEIESLNQEERKLFNALENNDTQRRIADLVRKREGILSDLKTRGIERKKYSSYLSKIGLEETFSEETFYTNLRIAGGMLTETDSIWEEIRDRLGKLTLQKMELQKNFDSVRSELEYLKKKRDNLPRTQSEIRAKIASGIGLSEKRFPFICELIRVKESEKEWTGALERLLRNFGLRMLVAEEDYEAVSAYVNSSYLGGKLVFSRMVPLSGPILQPKDKEEVFYKLELKSELSNVKKEWLEAQILREFGHICGDLNRLRKEEKALTKEGLIKSGRIRHEKDDRKNISDARDYILGWNNTEKIAALESEFALLGQNIYRLNSAIDLVREEENKNKNKRDDLLLFLRFEQFSQIDDESLKGPLQDTERQIRELELRSEEYGKLKEQYELAKARLTDVQGRQRETAKEFNVLEDRLFTLRKDMEDLQQRIRKVDRETSISLEPILNERLRETILTLESIAETERNFSDRLVVERDQYLEKRDSIGEELNKGMDRYVKRFREEADREELSVSVSNAEGFAKLTERIRQDRLPEFQEKFRTMMSDKVAKQILDFKAELDDDVSEIKERIDELNDSLKDLDYSKGKSYIQIRYFDTKDREIVGDSGFKEMLRGSIPDLGDSSHNEEKFAKIRELLKKLKGEGGSDRWSRLVTDPRNWLDFQAAEFLRDNNQILQVYDSSAGKSGGQTVKLAYTILASAIAYQFKIRERNSFRFVVIDEMFNNLDGENSRYALNLFRQLGLQLLVVTPMDKITIVEPYVRSVHFVKNNSEGNDSRVYPISKENVSSGKDENSERKVGNL